MKLKWVLTLCFILFITNIILGYNLYQSTSQKVEDAALQTKDLPREDCSTDGYLLIYGDWEVVGYLEGGKHTYPEILSTHIGSKISYRKDEIIYNGKISENISYNPYVIAMEDRRRFISSDFYPFDEDEVFDIESAYFSCFSPSIPGPLSILDSRIIVKNNNRIILDTIDGYLLLDRVAFIENLELVIAPI